jgi:hypothetical protein
MSVAGKSKKSKRSAPSIVIGFDGRRYRITVLASMPSRKPPCYVQLVRSADTGQVFRFEPILEPDAMADDFTTPFVAAVARLARLQAEAWKGPDDKPADAERIQSQVRSAVGFNLERHGPESRKRPERKGDPAFLRAMGEYNFVAELIGDRGTFLGGFSEEEVDRLKALADAVVERQLARMTGGAEGSGE